MRPTLATTVLVIAACLRASLFAEDACAGPQALEAKLHLHADADAYTELATWFGEHHRYDCAAEAYRSALKFEPGSAELYYLVGLSLYSSGRPDVAVDALQQSIFLMPEVLKPRLILAATLDQLQRSEDAKIQWEAALKIDRRSTVALDGLSKNLIAAGDYPSAIALLQSAPHSEDLTLDLALALGKAGKFAQASDLLTQALRANPSSLRLSNAMATVFINQGHFQEAVRWAAKSARLHPHDLEAQKFYLRVLVLNSDSAAANLLAKKLLTIAPHDFYVLYMNGILEVKAGKFSEARKHLEQAVALDPNHYNSRYNLGVALDELQDDRGAREQLEKALALGATEPEIRFTYANVLRKLGETHLAQEQLNRYQEQLKDKANHVLSVSKAAQADKELEAGDAQKAAALYREAVVADPKDSLLSYKLAMALDRSGDTVAERAALEQAIQIDPDMAIAQNQLGYLASRSGDSAAAEEHFRQAVRAAPKYTEAWVNLAATLGMESRFAEAQEAVASALKLDPKNAEARQLGKDLSAAEANR
jgi:Flp pilus assembly protein TadD